MYIKKFEKIPISFFKLVSFVPFKQINVIINELTHNELS